MSNNLEMENALLKEEILRLRKKAPRKEQLTEDKPIFKSEDKDPRLLPHKIIGCTVTGDVLLNAMEVEIINTPAFQRLNKIKQLGATNLVYRTALHTRFDHSLGVLKMADVIINKIRTNEHAEPSEQNITDEEEQIIRLLALLHDICHMPYGHTLEDEFSIFTSHDKNKIRWEYFLGPNSEIGLIIQKWWCHDYVEGAKSLKDKSIKAYPEFYTKFYNLILCDKDFEKYNLQKSAFMYDIVSNTISADLLDYLRRDICFTNLSIEASYRIINFCLIRSYTDSNKKEWRRVVFKLTKDSRVIEDVVKGIGKQIRKDSKSDLIQLLRSRYYLGERVYFHHTKIMHSTLLAAAVLRTKECFSVLTVAEKQLSDYKNADSNLYYCQLKSDEDFLNILRDIRFYHQVSKQIEQELSNPEIEASKSKNASWLKETILKQGYDTANLSKMSSDNIDTIERLINTFLNRGKYVELFKFNKNSNWNPFEGPRNDEKIRDGWSEISLKDDASILAIKETDFALWHIITNFHINSDGRKKAEDTIMKLFKIKDGNILIYCANPQMGLKHAKVLIHDDHSQDGRFCKELIDYKDPGDNGALQERCYAIETDHINLWETKVFINPEEILDATGKDWEPSKVEAIVSYLKYIFSSPGDKGKIEEKTFRKTYYFYVAVHETMAGVDGEKMGLINKLIDADCNLNFDGKPESKPDPYNEIVTRIKKCLNEQL